MIWYAAAAMIELPLLGMIIEALCQGQKESHKRQVGPR
jgi:hypothetical protein